MPPPRDEDPRHGDPGPPRSRREEDRAEPDHGRGSLAFQATFILVAIWLVLWLFRDGHAPNGLLIAAGIVFAVGLSNRLFGDRPRRHRRRPERPWRDARRRRWEDR